MLRTKLEISAAEKIPVGSNGKIQLKVCAKEPQPPTKSKIRITKPITGEKWILKPGAELPTEHCGGLLAELHKPRVYDYLGLFCFKVRKTGSQIVLVWPQQRKQETPPVLPQYLARSWRPKSGGGYSENHEIRPYRPGDNLNQIHWKLSAKVGDLLLREPMEPEAGRMVLTMDLCGTPEELDRKFEQLLWMGNWLLENMISFEIRALTGNGIESWTVKEVWNLRKCMESLLCSPFIREGSIRDWDFSAAWRRHVGGDTDEA